MLGGHSQPLGLSFLGVLRHFVRLRLYLRVAHAMDAKNHMRSTMAQLGFNKISASALPCCLLTPGKILRSI